jgi:Fe-S cluster biogenesis protein NfuA
MAKVRPYLQADGGDIELVAIEGQDARVRLKGACHG